MGSVRVGIVILPEYRWAEAEPLWRRAEEYGFAHAWTYDHLGWRSLVDGPWFDAVTTLTAAARATFGIRLGTFVASPNFRHPVHFAREVISLDDVSDGRLTLGVGAGGRGFDEAVLGGPPMDPGARMDRFVEFVQLLDRMLTQPRTTWRGSYYAAVDARSVPGCVQRPRVPFLIAGNGPRGMRLAARYGAGWVTPGQVRDDVHAWWREVTSLNARLDDVLVEAGRVPSTVDRYLHADASGVYSLSSVDCFADVCGRAAEAGFTDVVTHWPRAEGVYAGSEAVLERVAAEVLPAPYR
jgi:alkanesulfonate monooxygenase SsuD/methylene tetrahydromethanopterin reductase-like flavin-dependent oxidoreductase (luciferase family)